MVKRAFYPNDGDKHDLLTFLANVKPAVKTAIVTKLGQHAIKWNVVAHVELFRENNEGEIVTADPYFRSATYTTLTEDTFEESDLNEAFQKIYGGLERYIREASGWLMKSVRLLNLHTTRYAPLAGSSFLNLPESLKRSGSILNIRNTEDDKCFAWSILARMYSDTSGGAPDDVESYRQYESELNMRGIKYPVSISRVDKFERQNEAVSVNVFGFEGGEIVPLRITRQRGRRFHVNLLLITSVETTHYCLILDFNAFLNRTNTNEHKHFYCHYCLHGFARETLLAEHVPYCSSKGAQKIVLPSVDDATLKFSDYRAQMRVPFVIYCDFETLNRTIDTCTPDPTTSHTTATRSLDVCSFGYKVVCTDPRYTGPSVIYRGPDASRKFVRCLLTEKEHIETILGTIEPLEMSAEDERDFEEATHCGICDEPLSEPGDRVRDHDHVTGKFRCAAHIVCNLQYQTPTFIPVLFHGLRNFDSHIICQCVGEYEQQHGGIKCIPKNFEKYISFSLGSLRFLDSYQFLSASLESLVENLKFGGGGGGGNSDGFTHFHSEFTDRDVATMLLRKNVYMYDYMTDERKFDERQLPAKREFYSTLKKAGISDSDYDHACRVFRELHLNDLGEYHDVYLKTDVLLLADVFERFRSLCLADYRLDPCHYYSVPGLTFAAMLRMTNVELQLLTDIDHLQIFEKGIRGGVSMVSHRHAEANNPYMSSYDPNKPSVYLQYLDANNLYGWAMREKLPMRDFRFLDEREVVEFDIDRVAVDGETGYLVEASLAYPHELHESHNCLPLAPEKRHVGDDELSPYARELWRRLHGEHGKRPKTEKLVTTLLDKERYVLHYRNLKLYLSLGMEVKKIHRVLSFHQEAYLRPYIDFNTEKRARAKSEFEKFFYKLLNCSLFGKLMQNQRQYKDISLIGDEKKLKRLASKPTFRSCKIFNQSLVGVECKRAKVKITKPIYAGQAVLDLSKYLMYDFFYNYLKAKYGSGCRLLLTDTDSLLVRVETRNIFADMHENAYYFDTSDFAENNLFRSDHNRKIPGKFKDEGKGRIMTRFTGLRPKMYAFLFDDKEETKRAKGVSKAVIDKELRYAMYEETLFERKEMSSEMSLIRSRNHELFVETVRKKTLSPFDDKRYLLDNVESLAYGHYYCQLYDEYI